ERYERDRISLYASGRREGQSEATERDIHILIHSLKSAGMTMDFIKQQLMEHYHLNEAEAIERINSSNVLK
ncbi:MAG: hypothetical protein ACI39N_07700, partial [Lachnospiraceae bacterium]